jgi:hypothetical protein
MASSNNFKEGGNKYIKITVKIQSEKYSSKFILVAFNSADIFAIFILTQFLRHMACIYY